MERRLERALRFSRALQTSRVHRYTRYTQAKHEPMFNFEYFLV